MAAINCGADAVYIGAARFGAREAAGNSLQSIEQLARYAHRYWARVYVTVNTLLHDDELPQAEHLIQQLYESGVDALIIQDVGLLELDLPPLPLFASTQMHNHTPERVAFLEQVGFQRVILARELSLAQIQAIRACTNIELECFVHGALCVGYSGQCYLSYALGGRSGNRGQCAQPCRRPYSLIDGQGSGVESGRYLLSLRDLNLSASLADLLEAGVTSFKIEGRLKDKAYVMNVVGYYRQKLDDLLEARGMRASASGRCHLDFTPDPVKTFNRGFTSYFLHGPDPAMASPDTPKSTGEPLGKVTQLGSRSFTLEPGPELHPGDGLCYFDEQRELRGVSVNAVQGRTITPESLDGLKVGTLLYRNHDHMFTGALNRSRAGRKISVRLALTAAPGGLTLLAEDEDGNQANYELPCQPARAEKPTQALETIYKQLRKTGGSDFECSEVIVDLSEVYYLPISMLNALRRGVLENLAQVRVQNRPQLQHTAQIGAGGTAPFPQNRLAYTGNVLNHKAAAFYRRHGVDQIEPAAESGLDLRGRVVMTTRFCLKRQLDACPRQVGTGRLVGPLSLVDEQGIVYPLRFDCVNCQMQIYFWQRGE